MGTTLPIIGSLPMASIHKQLPLLLGKPLLKVKHAPSTLAPPLPPLPLFNIYPLICVPNFSMENGDIYCLVLKEIVFSSLNMVYSDVDLPAIPTYKPAISLWFRMGTRDGQTANEGVASPHFRRSIVPVQNLRNLGRRPRCCLLPNTRFNLMAR